MSKGLYCLFILILWCPALEMSMIPKPTELSLKTDYTKALNQTLHAMERLLSFYEEDIDLVNLDAIYGLRVAEGAMAVSLTEHGESFWSATETTKTFHQKLIQLRQQAGSINTRAQSSIKAQNKEYYYKFKDVVDKPWGFFKDFGKRTLPVTKVKEIKVVGSNWDEEMSDRCMSEVLGSNPNHTACMFSPVCVDAITDQKQKAYGPTHQILFLTVALMRKCEVKYSKILKQRLGMDVDGLIEDRCVRIISEMTALERPSVGENVMDLFMEQGFVCGLHGYEEFLSLERLWNVVSWQRLPGCFGRDEGKDDDNEGRDEDNEGRGEDNKGHDQDSDGHDDDSKGFGEDNDDQMDKLGDKVGLRSRRRVGSFRSMRRLLVDVIVDHGCSAHESGVAAGLLGLYTKWLLTKLDTGLGTPTVGPKHGKEGTVSVFSSVTHKPTMAKLMTRKTNKQTNPITDSSKSTNNEDFNTNHGNLHDNNVATKDIYIRSMVISVVTSLLTVAVLFSLYKLCCYVCPGQMSSRRKYRPLVDA